MPYISIRVYYTSEWLNDLCTVSRKWAKHTDSVCFLASYSIGLESVNNISFHSSWVSILVLTCFSQESRRHHVNRSVGGSKEWLLYSECLFSAGYYLNALHTWWFLHLHNFKSCFTSSFHVFKSYNLNSVLLASWSFLCINVPHNLLWLRITWIACNNKDSWVLLP